MSKSSGVIIKTMAVLTVICAVSALLLAVTNAVTEKRIADAAKKAETEAMARIIDAADYKKQTIEYEGSSYDYYVAVDETDAPVGYIFTVSQHGYGGDVKVMTGVGTDGAVAAIEVLDASGETPGLGQKATESSFWKLFSGKSGQLTASKSASGDGQIQAMTGATVTSKAVVGAVNKALTLYGEVTKGAGENG